MVILFIKLIILSLSWYFFCFRSRSLIRLILFDLFLFFEYVFLEYTLTNWVILFLLLFLVHIHRLFFFSFLSRHFLFHLCTFSPLLHIIIRLTLLLCFFFPSFILLFSLLPGLLLFLNLFFILIYSLIIAFIFLNQPYNIILFILQYRWYSLLY